MLLEEPAKDMPESLLFEMLFEVMVIFVELMIFAPIFELSSTEFLKTKFSELTAFTPLLASKRVTFSMTTFFVFKRRMSSADVLVLILQVNSD